MAKSIRSKRKQKVKAARREKYREREKKKLWEKHLAIQAQRTVDMADVEAPETEEAEPTTCEEPVDSTPGEPDAMDTGTKKLSNSQLKKIQEQWSSSRRKKRKAKKLGGKKAHTRW